MLMGMRVLVTGGGIGGLTTAVALRRIGVDVEVTERARAFGEVGAGVQLGPNATAVLRRRGTGVAPDEPAVALADGARLAADLVVGADGTHSTVRGATVGDAPARFSGMCAYRALIPVRPGDDLSVRLWLGPGRHVVI